MTDQAALLIELDEIIDGLMATEFDEDNEPYVSTALANTLFQAAVHAGLSAVDQEQYALFVARFDDMAQSIRAALELRNERALRGFDDLRAQLPVGVANRQYHANDQKQQ